MAGGLGGGAIGILPIVGAYLLLLLAAALWVAISPAPANIKFVWFDKARLFIASFALALSVYVGSFLLFFRVAPESLFKPGSGEVVIFGTSVPFVLSALLLWILDRLAKTAIRPYLTQGVFFLFFVILGVAILRYG